MDPIRWPAAEAPPPPWRDADYWAFADPIAEALDHDWDPRRDVYTSGSGEPIRNNSNMLLVHAIAAVEGHRGASRQDARARALVRRLTTRPAFMLAGGRLSRPSTCWATDMRGTKPGHLSLESKVAEALLWAWRARQQLDLPREDAQRIVSAVNACAWNPHWRYPALMGNQINWYSELYASAALLAGDGRLLRGDFRWQLERFANGITRPMGTRRTSNLGPGYAFRYRPDLPVTDAVNMDTPEYANIVAQFVDHYDEGVQRGMRPLTSRQKTLLKAWLQRMLSGTWTHAGYLNWDTGLGHERWHSAQYWAFAQQSLIALARSPELLREGRQARWAKAMFDRGLMLYRRLAEEAGAPIAPGHMYDVHVQMEDFDCYATRILSNAVRAIGLGLGRLPASDPPPLYAYDFQIGRVAVTTPRYSTAIVTQNRRAFEYGGIELARLFGPHQNPASGVGGSPPGAFGVVITPGAETSTRSPQLVSQSTRYRPRIGITSSPIGPVTRPRAYPERPYAGPFTRLTVKGRVARGSLAVEAQHGFSATEIESRWRVASRTGANHTVRAYFPTWGKRAAIDVVLRDGSVVRLTGESAPGVPIALADVQRVSLGGGGGYTLYPVRTQPGATLDVVTPAAQRTNPHPGPALAIVMARDERFGVRHLAVRIVPAARGRLRTPFDPGLESPPWAEPEPDDDEGTCFCDEASRSE